MTVTSQTSAAIVTEVRSKVQYHLSKALTPVLSRIDPAGLIAGKMLRTSLASRLPGAWPPDQRRVQLCAAIELVHTASLCHDDVIDNGLLRRAAPALWRTTGRSGAILIGDLLLCEATSMVLATGDADDAAAFMGAVSEVVAAEAQQELICRGKPLTVETCLRLARGKTGPLFAFAAGVCVHRSSALHGAITEAGYRIGTAYQVADDLLDVVGDEAAAGKTLGSDTRRAKFTLPTGPVAARRMARAEVGRLCRSACDQLTPWPQWRRGVEAFIGSDLQPALTPCDANAGEMHA